MFQQNQNRTGARFLAPDHLSQVEARTILPPNVMELNANPLMLFAVGELAELALDAFKDFTRYHRTGFSWHNERMARYSIVSGANAIREKRDEVGVTTEITVDNLKSELWRRQAFLAQNDASTVILADLSDQESFNLLESMMRQISREQDVRFLADLLLFVNKTERNLAGAQAARMRQISVWQEAGRHFSGNFQSRTLVSRAHYITKENLDKNTLQKMVLAIFSLYHSSRPLNTDALYQIRNQKNVALNFRSIQIPFKELIDLKAIKLTEGILFARDFLFTKGNLSTEEIERLKKDKNFKSDFINFNGGITEAEEDLKQRLNEADSPNRWEKLAITINFYMNQRNINLRPFMDYLIKSKDWVENISTKIEEKRKITNDSLSDKQNGNVMRWSPTDIEAETELITMDLFTEDQLKSSSETIFKRLGFAIKNGQPYIVYLPLNGNADNLVKHFYSGSDVTVKRLDKLVDAIFEDIQRELEAIAERNLRNLNARFLRVDNNTERYFDDIEDFFPEQRTSVRVIISHQDLNLEQSSNRLKTDFNRTGHVSEPGLAIFSLIEPKVNYLNFPTNSGYRDRDTNDERLKNALSYEQNWDGRTQHKFCSSTLLYLRNKKAVDLFFKAVRHNVINYDKETKWSLQNGGSEDVKLNQENDFGLIENQTETLWKAFKFFCLNGYDGQNPYSPFAPSNFEELLNELERQVNEKQADETIDKVLGKKFQNSTGELADIWFLYKKINGLDC